MIEDPNILFHPFGGEKLCAMKPICHRGCESLLVYFPNYPLAPLDKPRLRGLSGYLFRNKMFLVDNATAYPRLVVNAVILVETPNRLANGQFAHRPNTPISAATPPPAAHRHASVEAALSSKSAAHPNRLAVGSYSGLRIASLLDLLDVFHDFRHAEMSGRHKVRDQHPIVVRHVDRDRRKHRVESDAAHRFVLPAVLVAVDEV